MKIVAQFFGFLAIVLWTLSVQEKNTAKILLVQLLSNIFFVAQYLCLFAYSGAILYIVATLRCLVFYLYRKNGKNIPYTWLGVFLMAILIVSTITYTGIKSILPTLIVMSYTVATFFENPKYIRSTFLIVPMIEISYNFIVGAYMAVLGNVLEFSSGAISLVRNSKKKYYIKKNVKLAS